jgi:hypothetical protein
MLPIASHLCIIFALTCPAQHSQGSFGNTGSCHCFVQNLRMASHGKTSENQSHYQSLGNLLSAPPDLSDLTCFSSSLFTVFSPMELFLSEFLVHHVCMCVCRAFALVVSFVGTFSQISTHLPLCLFQVFTWKSIPVHSSWQERICLFHFLPCTRHSASGALNTFPTNKMSKNEGYVYHLSLVSYVLFKIILL